MTEIHELLGARPVLLDLVDHFWAARGDLADLLERGIEGYQARRDRFEHQLRFPGTPYRESLRRTELRTMPRGLEPDPEAEDEWRKVLAPLRAERRSNGGPELDELWAFYNMDRRAVRRGDWFSYLDDVVRNACDCLELGAPVDGARRLLRLLRFVIAERIAERRRPVHAVAAAVSDRRCRLGERRALSAEPDPPPCAPGRPPPAIDEPLLMVAHSIRRHAPNRVCRWGPGRPGRGRRAA